MKLDTNAESSLLMYFESQAVENGGKLESVRMNADDFAIAQRWNESGFIQFGRVASKDIAARGGVTRDYWCMLSEEAWSMAHAERRARCERKMSALTVQRIGVANVAPTKRPSP